MQQSPSDVQSTKSRYDFRKRTSPPVNQVSPLSDSLTKISSQDNVSQALEQPDQQQSAAVCDIFDKVYTSGYLRFNLKHVCSIAIASALLLVSLSIINYFNVFNANFLSFD